MKMCRGRMGLFLFLQIVLVVLLAIGVSAEEPAGRVLYHQDFADVDSVQAAGITLGTATVGNAWLTIEDDDLGIHTADDRRAYSLLPDTPWTDSHTIEFSFRFTEISASNGYIAFLLTCWGDEPSNISAAVFRANGTIDNFDDPDDAIRQKIQAGETIHVEIPVENGLVHTITLTTGEDTCTVQRDSILRIAEGERGFGVRNASVAVEEVYIVNGTGYTAKIGPFADQSWSDSELAENAPEHAPNTGEAPVWPVLLLLSVAGMCWAKRRKYGG